MARIGFVTVGDPLDYRQPHMEIFNDVGGTTSLPAGRYRVEVTRGFHDYETGERMVGRLLDEADIEVAREVGTTGWTLEHFSREYGAAYGERIRRARRAFNPVVVYFAGRDFAEAETVDPETFTDEDREDFERMGFAFWTRNRAELDDGTQVVEVLTVLPDGMVAHVQRFQHHRAFEDAASYMAAGVEAATTTLEERLGPFGLEWQREQVEHEGWL